MKKDGSTPWRQPWQAMALWRKFITCVEDEGGSERGNSLKRQRKNQMYVLFSYFF